MTRAISNYFYGCFLTGAVGGVAAGGLGAGVAAGFVVGVDEPGAVGLVLS